MRTFNPSILLVLSLLLLAACDGPAQPSGPAHSPVPDGGDAFEVAGIVTDEHGRPMPGATVTASHWFGQTVLWPSTVTDASGGYQLTSTGTLLGNQFVARLQVVADGYEEYWRSIGRTPGSTSSVFVENFRLDRITRIVAGESTLLSVPQDVGECHGWVAPVCPPVRIAVPTEGRLSVDVQPLGHNATASNPPGHSGELPPVEVCCVDGHEVYGNPITVSVATGRDVEVRIGLRRDLSSTLTFQVTTSLEPLEDLVTNGAVRWPVRTPFDR